MAPAQPQPAELQPEGDYTCNQWTCECGFSNRAGDTVCGGVSGLGCGQSKASRQCKSSQAASSGGDDGHGAPDADPGSFNPTNVEADSARQLCRLFMLRGTCPLGDACRCRHLENEKSRRYTGGLMPFPKGKTYGFIRSPEVREKLGDQLTSGCTVGKRVTFRVWFGEEGYPTQAGAWGRLGLCAIDVKPVTAC
eukprot:gene45727-45684_t